MRSPLSVRINSGGTDRLVTSKVHDLTFSKTAPGGHRQASCEVWLPPSQFDGLGPADRIYVYDPTTGTTAWEGYTDNPGERVGPGGMGFALSANGGMIRAADQAERLIYRDTSLDSWESESAGSFNAPSSTREVGQFPADAGTHAGKPALYLQFPPGQPIDDQASALLSYRGFFGAGNSFGGVTGFRDGGMTSAEYQVGLFLIRSFDGFPVATVDQSNLSGIGGVISLNQHAVSGFDFDPYDFGTISIRFALIRNGGATNVSSDNVWAALGDVAVLGGLRDRFGAKLGAPRLDYVLASEVVEDLLGRLLTDAVDAASAVVDTSTYHIDSLAFMDAATAANVIDALLKFEPDFDWGIGASTLTGKHSFWFRQWPTQPRYILTDDDGLDLPGSEDTLCNRVAVEWVDEKGKAQVEVVTADVPELGTRIKDADKVSLPEGRGSLANAQRIGAQVLASKNAVQVAGTASVDRPLIDLVSGQKVMPWNLEPGCVARLQTKGVDVRVTEVSYSDNDVSASLTLGNPVPDVDDLITELGR